ncbi:MAG: hypothetical protein ACSHX8_12390 [Opitutaceae bacterium]
MTICDFLSVSDYWYATISAIIGCFGGITWAKRQSEKETQKIDHESKSDLISAIEKLIELADQSEMQWFGNGVPNFPLENQRIISLTERISHFKDSGLRTALEGLVYQCSHYNNKLVVVNSACLDAILHDSHTETLDLYKTDMEEHAEKIVGWAKSALETLKQE